MKRIFLLAIALTLFACEDNTECRSLKRLIEKNQQILERASRRAAQGERIQERLQRAKAKADATMKSLGLEKSETETHQALVERAKKLGATVERGTRDVDPLTSQGNRTSETQWTFTFSAKTLEAATKIAYGLLETPPFVRFVGLNPPDGPRKTWRMDVTRGIVDRAPMDIKKTELPKRKDGSTIETEFGFCGAGELRQKLAKVNEQISAVEEKAAQMTIDLPMSASWEGVWRRAEVIRDIELESRRMIELLLAGVVAKKLTLKAVGVERDVVIIEVKGGPKQRGQLEQAIPTALVQQVQPTPTETPGVARLMLVNRTAERKRQDDERMKEMLEKRKKMQQQP